MRERERVRVASALKSCPNCGVSRITVRLMIRRQIPARVTYLYICIYIYLSLARTLSTFAASPPRVQFIVGRGQLGAFQLKTCCHSAKTFSTSSYCPISPLSLSLSLYLSRARERAVLCQKQLLFVNYKLYNYCRPSRCTFRPWPKNYAQHCASEMRICIFHTPHKRKKVANLQGQSPRGGRGRKSV